MSRNVELRFDLGKADSEHVVEIITENGSRYRIMRGTLPVTGVKIISDVAIRTSNPRMKKAAKNAVDCDRMVHIGQPFNYGSALKGCRGGSELVFVPEPFRNHTSPVESVYVGGRKVAG